VSLRQFTHSPRGQVLHIDFTSVKIFVVEPLLSFEKKKERNLKGPHLKRILPTRSLKNAFGSGTFVCTILAGIFNSHFRDCFDYNYTF
jgi:hypothetical protein